MHFKMEGLHTVKTLIQRNDWMAEVDLKDAILMVWHPISSSPIHKIRKITMEAHCLLTKKHSSAQHLSQLLGKINATTPALQMAPLFCRLLQICLKQTLAANQQNYRAEVQLSPQALEDLQWYLSSWNGRNLITQEASMTITSDAFLQGWGATCNGNS